MSNKKNYWGWYILSGIIILVVGSLLVHLIENWLPNDNAKGLNPKKTTDVAQVEEAGSGKSFSKIAPSDEGKKPAENDTVSDELKLLAVGYSTNQVTKEDACNLAHKDAIDKIKKLTCDNKDIYTSILLNTISRTEITKDRYNAYCCCDSLFCPKNVIDAIRKGSWGQDR